MRNTILAFICVLAFILSSPTTIHAQFFTNEKIEAEDMDIHRISETSWMIVGTGEGWIPHPDSTVLDTSTWEGPWYPSKFVYARCGNRHWLCDDRTIERCIDYCADEYLEADVIIPETGDYLIYAYVANWADSAVIEDNRGCFQAGKWECSAWFVNWDDVDALEKIEEGSGEYNVSIDYIWKTYPYRWFCGHFGLDTVSLGYERGDCEPYGNPVDPVDCDFPAMRFYLTAGLHTLYLKVAEEFTLIDWVSVVKDGDDPPIVEPGIPYEPQQVGIAYDETVQPAAFRLSQNYPNPFNAATIIRYSLPWQATVQLTVYDILGTQVTELVSALQPAGAYHISFDASQLSSGIYFYRLEALCTSCEGGATRYSDIKKMVYLK